MKNTKAPLAWGFDAGTTSTKCYFTKSNPDNNHRDYLITMSLRA